MKVCIDAGHGGVDPGAVSDDPFHAEEKHINLAIAALLEEELESLGHWVVMDRRKDRTLSLHARAAFSNRLGADLFVSIHANAAVTKAAEGMEIFCFPGSVAGNQAAQTVLNSLAESFPDHKNRGVKEANWTVLRLTTMPAILVETEFLTNPDQLNFLSDPVEQQKMAGVIATGINRI